MVEFRIPIMNNSCLLMVEVWAFDAAAFEPSFLFQTPDLLVSRVFVNFNAPHDMIVMKSFCIRGLV